MKALPIFQFGKVSGNVNAVAQLAKERARFRTGRLLSGADNEWLFSDTFPRRMEELGNNSRIKDFQQLLSTPSNTNEAGKPFIEP